MSDNKQKAQALQSELQTLSQRYYGLQSDLKEHKRVLEQLEHLEPERISYRLIGDVLAKETVGEVKPVLTEMVANLENVLQQMEKTIEAKSKEFNELAK